jgi:hypothetical protein
LAPIQHQEHAVPASVLLGFAGSVGAGLLAWTVIIKMILWALMAMHPA